MVCASMHVCLHCRKVSLPFSFYRFVLEGCLLLTSILHIYKQTCTIWFWLFTSSYSSTLLSLRTWLVVDVSIRQNRSEHQDSQWPLVFTVSSVW